MQIKDYICLLPLLILSAAPLVIMLTIVVVRNIKVVYGFSLLSFIAAFISLFFVSNSIPHSIEPLFIFDKFSILFLGIIYLASILITILSYIYFKSLAGEKEEYFIILFVATLGASILVLANNFVSLFLGLEVLSISLFILIAYTRSRSQSIEAGVKYYVMASVSSAFLLFGMGLIYVASGTLYFPLIAISFNTLNNMHTILLAGFAMMLVGIGFKLAIVPFHLWIPDVYEGSSVPVAAYIATISKGAVLAVFIRFFLYIDDENTTIIFIISAIAIISMFVGNLLALKQTNLKRLLAYSSIAHIGYLLINLLIGNELAFQVSSFYIITYILTSLGAFSVISVLSTCSGDADKLDYYKGLFWKNPILAIVLTISLLSLAGIPLTAGFMAKFYLVLAGAKSGLWILIFSLIINTVISIYYYLRVIKTMFSSSDKDSLPAISFTSYAILVFIALCILILGIFPSLILDISI